MNAYLDAKLDVKVDFDSVLFAERPNFCDGAFCRALDFMQSTLYSDQLGVHLGAFGFLGTSSYPLAINTCSILPNCFY